jgi:hypothetical protein
LSNDPIFNILRANERIFRISEKINSKLKQICERVDVDRPILMRDKLDFMWKEASKDNVDIEFVSGQLKKRKKDREIVNAKQLKIYG